MGKTIAGFGNLIGAFYGGFLVYVVAGSLAGRAIVLWQGGVPQESPPCWPFHSPILLRLHLVDDEVFAAIWTVAVAVPSVIVEFPALVVRLALLQLSPGSSPYAACYMIEDWLIFFAPALVALLSVGGLVFWSERARLFAMALGLLLLGEVVAIALLG